MTIGSLAEALAYSVPPPTAAQRLAQAAGATRAGAWVFSRTLPTLDAWVHALTRGRHTLPGLLAGLPVIELVTTGRRSGQPRRTHLIALPRPHDLVVIGTNFGQRSTPAWVLNLEADPVATVGYRGRSVGVVARPVTGRERAATLTAAERMYAGYGAYRQRITGRHVRVLALEPSLSPGPRRPAPPPA